MLHVDCQVMTFSDDVCRHVKRHDSVWISIDWDTHWSMALIGCYVQRFYSTEDPFKIHSCSQTWRRELFIHVELAERVWDIVFVESSSDDACWAEHIVVKRVALCDSWGKKGRQTLLVKQSVPWDDFLSFGMSLLPTEYPYAYSQWSVHSM